MNWSCWPCRSRRRREDSRGDSDLTGWAIMSGKARILPLQAFYHSRAQSGLAPPCDGLSPARGHPQGIKCACPNPQDWDALMKTFTPKLIVLAVLFLAWPEPVHPASPWVLAGKATVAGQRWDIPLGYDPEQKRFVILGGRTSFAEYRKPRPYDVLLFDPAMGQWENAFPLGKDWGRALGQFGRLLGKTRSSASRTSRRMFGPTGPSTAPSRWARNTTTIPTRNVSTSTPEAGRFATILLLGHGKTWRQPAIRSKSWAASYCGARCATIGTTSGSFSLAAATSRASAATPARGPTLRQPTPGNDCGWTWNRRSVPTHGWSMTRRAQSRAFRRRSAEPAAGRHLDV